MQSLQDVLTDDYGLDLSGWQLLVATDVTPDGSTITGYENNPSGPEPSTGFLVMTGLLGLASYHRGQRLAGLGPRPLLVYVAATPLFCLLGGFMRIVLVPFVLNRFTVVALGLVAVFGIVRSASAAPMFQGLGDLTGGAFSSIANGVSANGSVVVGSSNSSTGSEAFRWTASGGMVDLGEFPSGNLSSVANGVSTDGSTVVGFGHSAFVNEAFLWTENSGVVNLGDLPNGSLNGSALGVSADGSVDRQGVREKLSIVRVESLAAKRAAKFRPEY